MKTKPLFTQPPLSLCIMRLSAIGDVTHAVPVIRTLQKHWPDTHITWVIGKLEHTLVGDIEGVRFVVVNKDDGEARSKLRQEMKGEVFDVLLNMQVSMRATWLSRVIPAKKRLGFDRERARDWQWLFNRTRIAPNPRAHVIDGFFDFLARLGLREREERWDIPMPDAARAKIAKAVPEGPLLVINPCTSARANNFRNWPIERYAAVADYAADRHGLKIVLAGGPDQEEKEYGDLISMATKANVTSLIGQTSLKESLALMTHATVVIAPDTGPLHIANAAGTPVIGLYASSNPRRTGPVTFRDYVVDAYPRALQHYTHKTVDQVRWGQRIRDPDVMDLIEVDEVKAMLDRVMGDLSEAE